MQASAEGDSVELTNNSSNSNSSILESPSVADEPQTGLPSVTSRLFAEYPLYNIYQITVTRPPGDDGSVVSLGLALQTEPIPRVLYDELGLSTCAMVESVHPASLGHEAGIVKNDVIWPHGTAHAFVQQMQVMQKNKVFSVYVARCHAPASLAVDDGEGAMEPGPKKRRRRSPDKKSIDPTPKQTPTQADEGAGKTPVVYNAKWPAVAELSQLIYHPNDTDVLIGHHPHHPGNETYLGIVAYYVEAYRHAKIGAKIVVAQRVVDEIVHQRGGRFLQPTAGGCYHVVSSDEAARTALRALRNKSQNSTPPPPGASVHELLAPMAYMEPTTPVPLPPPTGATVHEPLAPMAFMESKAHVPLPPRVPRPEPRCAPVAPWPDEIIDSPSDRDVVLGFHPRHAGNIAYRALVASRVDAYRRAKMGGGARSVVVQQIVHEIGQRGGRFVKVRLDGRFRVVSDNDAYVFVIQALGKKSRRLGANRPVKQTAGKKKSPQRAAASTRGDTKAPPTRDAANPNSLHRKTQVTAMNAPRDIDVIVGHYAKHPGNATYRSIVASFVDSYRETRVAKRRVAQMVVNEVSKTGGRFVKLMPDGAFQPVAAAEATQVALEALKYKSKRGRAYDSEARGGVGAGEFGASI